jgi:hypothetical protein
LDLGYTLNANMDVAAKAAFTAKMSALKAEGAVMLKSFTKLRALIDGQIDGQVVFDPAPLVAISTQLSGMVQAGATGSLFADIPKARLICVIPAMSESVTLLGNITSNAGASIQAKAGFVTFLTTGG